LYTIFIYKRKKDLLLTFLWRKSFRSHFKNGIISFTENRISDDGGDNFIQREINIEEFCKNK